MSVPNSLHDVQVHASPSDAPWLDDPAMTFWKPSFAEQLKLMSWKHWLTFAAIPVGLFVIFGVFMGAFFTRGHYVTGMSALLVKLGIKPILLGAAFLSTGGYKLAKKAMAGKTDPFCIRCGYSLLGLPDGHRCPECGLPISHAIIAEYRRDPEHFVSRWKARHAHVAVPVAALDVPKNARRRRSPRGGA